jgi:hypothetical protein
MLMLPATACPNSDTMSVRENAILEQREAERGSYCMISQMVTVA